MSTKAETGNETPLSTGREKVKYIKLNKLLFFCVLSVLLIFLIAGLYLLNRQHIINEKFGSFITLQNEQNKQFSSMQDLQKLKTELNISIGELNQKDIYSNQDWAIAEVEYLLILALHRLSLEKDVKTAITAMLSADARIQNIEDPALLPVKEQLVKDINRLKSINVIDTSAMAIFLADMINRVDQLPLNDLKINQTKERTSVSTDQAGESDESGLVLSFLREVWLVFKSLLVIKHKDEIRQALILPGQEYYLYQNLRLELGNARLSVLRRDTDNLDMSISIIIEWLKSYFDMNDASVINLVDTLQQMQQQDLSPELPDINSSLESLRAFIRSSEN